MSNINKILASIALAITIASGTMYFTLRSSNFNPYVITIDYGKCKQCADITFSDITIVNVSQEAIRLIGYVKNCDCIDFSVAKNTVNANESTICSMAWNSGETCGKVTAYTRILFKGVNTGKDYYYEIVANVTVMPHYTPSCSVLEVDIGDTDIYYITLNCSEDPLYFKDPKARFIACNSNCPSLIVSLESPERIMIIYDPSINTSHFDAVINITTDSTYRKSLRVPVRFIKHNNSRTAVVSS